jgi:murein DD-endopeptidase MepM/ murein hydrolase activator NlpD
MLVCAIFAYFQPAAGYLSGGAAGFVQNAGFALRSHLFPEKADMGGMETQYAENSDYYDVSYREGEGAPEIKQDGSYEPEDLGLTVPLVFFAHTLQPGDMIGNLAIKYGLNEGTLISVNGIQNSRTIQAGKEIKIPNQDGIFHKAAAGETVGTIAEKYEVNPQPIVTANELFSEKINAGGSLFVPGAKLNEAALQEINGDLFIRPIRGRITSRYGWRISPITGRRGFHSGLDIAAPTGTPIGAGMSGRVSSVGYSAVFGNYVIISHHSNYRTLYAHLSSIKTRGGAYVSAGQTIGYVGNTGQSTGPHLHFQVYKNGSTINPALLMR